MVTKCNRAFIDPLTLVFIGGVAAGVFIGNWEPFYKLRGKEPPTKQVAAAQAELAKATAEAQAREAALNEANKAERQVLESQVRSAQQDNVGTVEALKRVPAEHATAEVKLASAMAQRVSLKLARAIGNLPADQQDAMILLIEQALSEKQAEVDEAYRKLAERDAAFAQLSAERDHLNAVVIPAIQQDKAEADAKAAALAEKVNEATGSLAKWAKEKYAAEAKARGFQATIDKLINLALWGAGLYVFIVFILPGIVKHMAPGKLKNFLRDVNGLSTNPLTYLDAKRKLNDLKAPSDP